MFGLGALKSGVNALSLGTYWDALVEFDNSADMSLVDGHSNKWFLSPAQHTFEMIVWVAISLNWVINTKDQFDFKVERRKTRLSRLSKICAVVLALSWLCNLYYKIGVSYHKCLNIFYPCHLFAVLQLLCVWLFDSHYKLATFIFNYMVGCPFYALVAIATPDPGYLKMVWPFEEYNWVGFWFFHIMILVTWLVLALKQPYPLYKGMTWWTFYVLSNGLSMIYGFVVQGGLSLIFNHNINYMTSPPPGVPGFLSTKLYRLKVPFLVFIGFVCSSVVTHLIVWLRNLLLGDHNHDGDQKKLK